MNRLKRLVEIGSHQERTGRTAYVLRRETLPNPRAGFDWVEDSTFNAAESVLADTSLKDVFSTAIANGYALVDREAPSPAKAAQMRANVYTVEIDGKPIVSFEAKSAREASELAKEDWFRDDLESLTAAGEVLWDGTAPLRARLATEPEISRYREFAAEAEEEGGDLLLAFLVTLDGAPASRTR